MMREVHPDRQYYTKSTTNLSIHKVQKAYEILINPKSRQEYDMSLRSASTCMFLLYLLIVYRWTITYIYTIKVPTEYILRSEIINNKLKCQCGTILSINIATICEHCSRKFVVLEDT